MTDTKNHTATASGSLEGRVFRPTSLQDLAEAIELAFDYRGDVTLELTSGESLVGYLFNRDAAGSDPWIELFPPMIRLLARSHTPRSRPWRLLVKTPPTGDPGRPGSPRRSPNATPKPLESKQTPAPAGICSARPRRFLLFSSHATAHFPSANAGVRRQPPAGIV